MFNALLADPYGWLDRNAPRVTAIKTSDDTGAVLVDGQPAIPIVGLPMKKDEGRGMRCALPTNAAGGVVALAADEAAVVDSRIFPQSCG